MTTPTPAAQPQILTWAQRIEADPNFIGVRSNQHMFDYVIAEVIDLRAAFAAVPAVDRNAVLEEAACVLDTKVLAFEGCEPFSHRVATRGGIIDSAAAIRELKSAAPPATAEQSSSRLYDWKSVDGKQHDTGRVTVNGGSYFATTASPENARKIAEALNAGVAQPVAPVPASEAARDAALYRQLNTPEIADFLKGVEREALHQRDRWGADHDAGKAAEDWFWLLGYLGGKALHAAKSGNADKALHHTISSAAALLNWHAAILGTHTAMRPGIATPADTQQQEKK